MHHSWGCKICTKFVDLFYQALNILDLFSYLRTFLTNCLNILNAPLLGLSLKTEWYRPVDLRVGAFSIHHNFSVVFFQHFPFILISLLLSYFLPVCVCVCLFHFFKYCHFLHQFANWPWPDDEKKSKEHDISENKQAITFSVTHPFFLVYIDRVRLNHQT